MEFEHKKVSKKRPGIKKCLCESPYQDKRYGKGKRLFNETVAGYRCTVCRREEK